MSEGGMSEGLMEGVFSLVQAVGLVHLDSQRHS